MLPSSATSYFQMRWPSRKELSETGEPTASVRYKFLSSGDKAIPFVRPIVSSRTASPFVRQSHTAPVEVPQSWPLKNTRPDLDRARSFGTPWPLIRASLQKSSPVIVCVFNLTTLPCPTSAKYTNSPVGYHFMPLKTAPSSPVNHAVPSARPITFRPTLLPPLELSPELLKCVAYRFPLGSTLAPSMCEPNGPGSNPGVGVTRRRIRPRRAPTAAANTSAPIAEWLHAMIRMFAETSQEDAARTSVWR